MTTAEAVRSERSSPSKSEPVRPTTPLLSSAWLLRVAGIAAVVAGIMGTIVAPGVRGNVADPAVVTADWISGFVAYFLMGALIALFLESTLELVRTHEIPVALRAMLVGGGGGVVALSGAALHDRIPPLFALFMGASTIAVALTAALCAARAPHTRAVGGLLFAFAVAATVRLAAWEIALRADEAANLTLFWWSRWLANVGVLIEGAGQVVAVLWLSTRGRWSGQLGLTFALLAAVGVTWGASQGAHPGAAFWQAIVHSAMAEGFGVPARYPLAALAVFLAASSLSLALAAVLQPNQVVAIAAAMSLTLVSRGAFDAPLRALCAVVASQWIAIAGADERAMWRTLLDDRARTLEP